MPILQTGHRRRGSGLTTDMVPDLERAIILMRHKNRTVYVDSAAVAGGNGDSWGGAYATLALAMAAALVGDTVLVAPGHAEVIVAAAGVAVAKSGVSIIGVGTGRRRPQINFTTLVGASFDVTAANVWLENITFLGTGLDTVTSLINVSAADCSIVGCEFVTGNVTNQAALCVTTTAAADRFVFESNNCYGSADAGTVAVLQIVGGDAIRIVDNNFQGNYTAGIGAINNVTTAMTNALIKGNTINNRTASATKSMVFVAGSTGHIQGNMMQILSGTAPITGAGMSWVGANYYVGTIATAGTLI